MPEEDKWEVPPFDGIIKDGYIYGRGKCYVKDAVMVLFKKYSKENNCDRRSLFQRNKYYGIVILTYTVFIRSFTRMLM